MRVPSTEVQNNFGKYMNIAATREDVTVTRLGVDIIKMIPCTGSKMGVEEQASAYFTDGSKHISAVEFREMIRGTHQRFELIAGIIYRMDSPNYFHQRASAKLLIAFSHWFEGKTCVPITAPFDITLAEDEEHIHIVQPDLAVLCDPENMDRDGRYIGTPSLVVELTSRSSRDHDMFRKLHLYRMTGVREYWIVDIQKQHCIGYCFNDCAIADSSLFTGESIVVSTLFDGLQLPLKQIFP